MAMGLGYPGLRDARSSRGVVAHAVTDHSSPAEPEGRHELSPDQTESRYADMTDSSFPTPVSSPTEG